MFYSNKILQFKDAHQCLPRVNCEWAEWLPWDSCTVTCSGGVRHRVRNVKQQALNGGELCNIESSMKNGHCVNQQCPCRCRIARGRRGMRGGTVSGYG